MPATRLALFDVLLSGACGLALVTFVAGRALPRLGTELLGTAQADKFGALYLHDELHRSLAAGRFPLVDRAQLWPVGAPLAAMNGDNVVEMLVSGVFRLFAPFPLWFNLAHLAWPPLLAMAFVPLARRLWPGDTTDGRLLRAAAAGTWAASPVFFGEIVAGRLTQVVLLGLPLALAALDAAVAGPLTRRQRALGAAGIALVGLGYWFYAVFLGILAPVFLVRGALAGRGAGTFRELLWLGGGALVLVSPALAGIAYAAASLQVSPSIPAPPGGLSPVFDNALQLMKAQPAQLQGWFVWGLVPGFLLALPALRRRGRGWVVLAAFCLLFALGPGQRLGARVWLLPYWPLWRHLPGLTRLTHPSRWLDFGMIFLVIVSFGGLARHRLTRWLAPLVPVALAAQLTLQGTASLPTFALRSPKLYVEAGKTKGALVVLPLMHAADTIAFTIFHHRPVIGGMAEGLPWSWPPRFRAWVEGNPLLVQLLALGDGKVATLDVRQGDVDALRDAGFTQVLYDTDAGRRWRHGAEPAYRAALEAAFRAPRLGNAEGALWDLPTQAPPGHAVAPPGVRLPEP